MGGETSGFFANSSVEVFRECLAIVYDLENFTNFVNHSEGQRHVPQLLDTVFAAISEVLVDPKAKLPPLRHQKFLGDGMLLIWAGRKEAPLSLENVAALCSHFRKVQKNFAALVRPMLERLPDDFVPSGVRFGMARGSALELKLAKSSEFVGVPLNLASRLQSYCPGLSFIVHAEVGLTRKMIRSLGLRVVTATSIRGFERQKVYVSAREYDLLDTRLRRRLFIDSPSDSKSRKGDGRLAKLAEAEPDELAEQILDTVAKRLSPRTSAIEYMLTSALTRTLSDLEPVGRGIFKVRSQNDNAVLLDHLFIEDRQVHRIVATSLGELAAWKKGDGWADRFAERHRLSKESGKEIVRVFILESPSDLRSFLPILEIQRKAGVEVRTVVRTSLREGDVQLAGNSLVFYSDASEEAARPLYAIIAPHATGRTSREEVSLLSSPVGVKQVMEAQTRILSMSRPHVSEPAALGRRDDWH